MIATSLRAAATLLVLAPATHQPASRALAQPVAPAATLVVRRAAGDSTVLTDAQLGALPRHEVHVVEHGRPALFAGVWLQDALHAAGVRTDSLRGPALADVLVAQAADGYRVAFTAADLAPDIGARVVLLADHRDGQPLGPTEGPLRLVLPADGRPARWIRQLRTITVRRAPD